MTAPYKTSLRHCINDKFGHTGCDCDVGTAVIISDSWIYSTFKVMLILNVIFVVYLYSKFCVLHLQTLLF